VVAYFLTPELTTQRLLFRLKPLDGTYSGKNQAPLLVQIIKEFNISYKLGFFVGDNTTNNNATLDFIGLDLRL
jgi:hypothetical protein